MFSIRFLGLLYFPVCLSPYSTWLPLISSRAKTGLGFFSSLSPLCSQVLETAPWPQCSLRDWTKMHPGPVYKCHRNSLSSGSLSLLQSQALGLVPPLCGLCCETLSILLSLHFELITIPCKAPATPCFQVDRSHGRELHLDLSLFSQTPVPGANSHQELRGYT